MELHWDDQALALQRRIQSAGHKCVLVGGAVRDVLRGGRPTDYDLAADADTETLLQILPEAKHTGGEYGTVTVYASTSAGLRGYEITPFRSESGYTDSRHPDAVRFGVDLQQDLARRDFTVNAMAWDGEKIIDLFGGRADLEARCIRTVGDPAYRFTEDALRILRALRFASVLDFSLEPATLAAALDCSNGLRALPLPRIKSELQAALLGRNPAALDEFVNADSLAFLGLHGGGTTLAPLAAVPCGMLLRWWAFLTLVGADKKYFCAHLGFSQSFYRELVQLDAWFAAPADRITLKRRVAKPLPASMEDILQTFAALDDRFAADRDAWQQVLAAGEPCTAADLAITGRELLAQGLHGPALGKRLDLLLEAVLAEPSLNTPATLLALSKALDGIKH